MERDRFGGIRKPFSAGAFVSLHVGPGEWIVKTKEHKFKCSFLAKTFGPASSIGVVDEMGRKMEMYWQYNGNSVVETMETFVFDKYFPVNARVTK